MSLQNLLPRIVMEVEDSTALSPEQCLCVAIIHRAVLDASKYLLNPESPEYKIPGREAIRWVQADEPNEMFSFRWCCDAISSTRGLLSDGQGLVEIIREHIYSEEDMSALSR